MEEVIERQQVSQVQTLQFITIAWMSIELCVAVYSGVCSHSIALTAFGADSAIELLSALVVLRRFALGPATEKRAAQISGFLLYGLAAYIVVTSLFHFLGSSTDAQPTFPGIAVLIAAAVVMRLLGRAKKRLARKTDSQALNADAAQSNICGYMSWIALAGLLLNRFVHLHWADPLAALLLLPIVLQSFSERQARPAEVQPVIAKLVNEKRGCRKGQVQEEELDSCRAAGGRRPAAG